ncbi:MAG: iron-containing alcohol dehydrogenase, partial [Cyanobacteriota bacterium]|nr:iron-containing alcohol dehydrogenase [Cyanobacteriota bacterium]
MVRSISSHSIAPARVLRGVGAWDEALPQIKSVCSRPLVLGRSASTAEQRQRLVSDLQVQGLKPLHAQLQFDCCEQDLQRVAAEVHRCDAVLAAGGGKVLDAGKLLACRLSLPCITVPLSASTCAGWTAISNIYSPQGAFEGDVALDRCPDLLVFDHGLVRQAPTRTLASGVADALAKWYEA